MARKLALSLLAAALMAGLLLALNWGWSEVQRRQVNSRLLATDILAGDYTLGDYRISWIADDGGRLVIGAAADRERMYWSTVPGDGFLAAARGSERVVQRNGRAEIHDARRATCNGQSIENVAQVGNELILQGTLDCNGEFADIGYQLRFVPVGEHLAFELQFSDPWYNRSYLTLATPSGDGWRLVDTAGETTVLSGQRITILSEGTSEPNEPVGGSKQVLLFFLDANEAIGLDPGAAIVLDARKQDRLQIQQFAAPMKGYLLTATSPAELVNVYQELLDSPLESGR